MTCKKKKVMLMLVIKNHLPSDLLADDLERLKYLLISPINNIYRETDVYFLSQGMFCLKFCDKDMFLDPELVPWLSSNQPALHVASLTVTGVFSNSQL